MRSDEMGADMGDELTAAREGSENEGGGGLPDDGVRVHAEPEGGPVDTGEPEGGPVDTGEPEVVDEPEADETSAAPLDEIAARLEADGPEVEPADQQASGSDTEPGEPEGEEPGEPEGEEPGETPAEPWAPVDAPAPDELSVAGGLDESLPREMDLGPDKRVRWWPWALAGLAVVVVLGAAGYAWWWSTARPVVVPDVVGKRAAEATQVLNDVSLSLGGVSEVPTDSAPPGTVIGQKPEAGDTLKPGGAVSFVVAAVAEQTKVPVLEGVSVEDAARDLAKARLRYVAVESFSETVAAGFVMSQLPSAGVEMPPGAAVALVVSRGMAPAASPVPGVAGLAEADAVRLLESSGFVARVSRSIDPSIPVGVVLEQRPAASASAKKGSIVQVLVSQGAGAGTRVPDVEGDTRRSAVGQLRARGLKASVVSVPDPTVPRGRVISQMPRTGRVVPAGAAVDLVVSLGDVTLSPVPSVIGTASAAATASAEASGFAGVVVTTEMAGVEHGVVIAQFPLPGTVWTRGYPIVCLVAEPPRP